MEPLISLIYTHNAEALTEDQIAQWYAGAGSPQEFAAIAGSGLASREILLSLKKSASVKVRAAVATKLQLSDNERTDWVLTDISPTITSALTKEKISPAGLEKLADTGDETILGALFTNAFACGLTEAPGAFAKVFSHATASKKTRNSHFYKVLAATPVAARSSIDHKAVARIFVDSIRRYEYHTEDYCLRKLTWPDLWHELLQAAGRKGSSEALIVFREFFLKIRKEKDAIEKFLHPADYGAAFPEPVAKAAVKERHPDEKHLGLLNPRMLNTVSANFVKKNEKQLITELHDACWGSGSYDYIRTQKPASVEAAWRALIENKNLGLSWLSSQGFYIGMESDTADSMSLAIAEALRNAPEKVEEVLGGASKLDASSYDENYHLLLIAIANGVVEITAQPGSSDDADKKIWRAVLKHADEHESPLFWHSVPSGHRLLQLCPELYSVSILRDTNWPKGPPGNYLTKEIAKLVEELGPASMGSINSFLMTYEGNIEDFVKSIRGILYKQQPEAGRKLEAKPAANGKKTRKRPLHLATAF